MKIDPFALYVRDFEGAKDCLFGISMQFMRRCTIIPQLFSVLVFSVFPMAMRAWNR